MHFNKKASLEMSIQAIVIVVLAMTLLGLGLGFIKGMFRNITSTTEDVSEQIRQRVLDDLVQGDKKISFPKTEIVVKSGEATILTVGVRNKEAVDLIYRVKFNLIDPDPTTATEPLIRDFEKNFQFKTGDYTLHAADADIRNIRLTIPTGTPQRSYFLTFKVEQKNPATNLFESYAEKDFFVVVRG